jgi:AcrR family transcriptional regulator
MVQISHSGSNEEKVNEILLAAQNRFGKFGFSKTAMHEIADDLGISKASLYYYYPDKESLFRAVFEKEKQVFIDVLHKTIDNSDDAKQLLYDFTNLRLNNFKYLMNLGRTNIEDLKGMRKATSGLWSHFREKEQDEIKRIFTKGIKRGIFKIQNKDEMAKLFLDLLRGLSHIHIKHKDFISLDEEELKNIERQVKLFTDTFIKGISK